MRKSTFLIMTENLWKIKYQITSNVDNISQIWPKKWISRLNMPLKNMFCMSDLMDFTQKVKKCRNSRHLGWRHSFWFDKVEIQLVPSYQPYFVPRCKILNFLQRNIENWNIKFQELNFFLKCWQKKRELLSAYKEKLSKISFHWPSKKLSSISLSSLQKR